jgi:Asp-tRNA(Asn)/Glu-tRNA(Gln) amidotransferase A subunit family amidase
LIWTVSFAS